MTLLGEGRLTVRQGETNHASVVSFLGLDDAAFEGLYRFGGGGFDIGVRGDIKTKSEVFV